MAKRRSDSANDTSSGATSRAKAPRTRRSLATAPVDPAVIAAASTESMSLTQEPSEEEIRYRAYFRYLERGGMNGSAWEDWLHAEQELKKN